MIVIACGLFILFLLIEAMIYIYGKKREEISCEYMIVLGAGLYGDRISSALKRRLDAAYIYALTYPCQIVVSGGMGRHETCTEASAMKRYLCSLGIDKERIIEEDTSTSTYTNFRNTRRLLPEKVKELMVVSCDFHMLRAMGMGKHAGFLCHRWPAPGKGVKQIRYYVREAFCLVKFWIGKK